MASTYLTCKPSAILFAILFNSLLNYSGGNLNQLVHKRFEYKYSFKPPYLAQKDGTVPFWEYGGSKYCFDYSIKVSFNIQVHMGHVRQ